MRRFARQPEPAFWAELHQRWLDLLMGGGEGSAGDKLRSWRRQGRTMAEWFHSAVRARDEAHLCPYSDGELMTQSGETIDHFIPEHVCPELGLAWDNLYPSCVMCNTHFKGTKWSAHLARPDLDPVDSWIEFDPETGELSVAPEFERLPNVRRRVKRTIRMFGLNDPDRCRARRRAWRDLVNAECCGDHERVHDQRASGPYRFVVDRFIRARQDLHNATARNTSPTC